MWDERGGSDAGEGGDPPPAAEQLMTVQQCRVGTATVLTVAGEVDMLTAPRLQEAVDEALRDPAASDVVVDLTSVTFLGSHGLAALVTAARAAQQHREALRIVVDHQRPVIQPIRVTGLDGVLALYHRLDEALPPASEPTL
jgi:anti-sigma B factor antagonist